MTSRKLNAAEVARLREIAAELRGMIGRHGNNASRGSAHLEQAARHVLASAAEINQAIAILDYLAPTKPARSRVGGAR